MPSAVPPSFGVCRTHRDRRPGGGPLAIGAARYRWRSAPEPTGVGGGLSARVLRVRSGGSRVHSPPPSPRFPPTTGSLCRRSTGTRPVHSPYSCQWRGWWQGRAPGVKRPVAGTRPSGEVARFEARATHDRQRRIAREPDIGRRSLAEPEDGAARRADHARVAAGATQARRRSAGAGRYPAGRRLRHGGVAERVGFEPTKSFDSALFKSAAINHSATSPGRQG